MIKPQQNPRALQDYNICVASLTSATCREGLCGTDAGATAKCKLPPCRAQAIVISQRRQLNLWLRGSGYEDTVVVGEQVGASVVDITDIAKEHLERNNEYEHNDNGD